jgi:hypothetical protein
MPSSYFFLVLHPNSSVILGYTSRFTTEGFDNYWFNERCIHVAR